MTAITKIAINIGLPNKHRKYYLPTDLTVNQRNCHRGAGRRSALRRSAERRCSSYNRWVLVEDYHDMPLSHGQMITLVHRN